MTPSQPLVPRRIRLNPRCLLTELGDGTGVVLDLDTKFYFTLNPTGLVVWKALEAAPNGTSPRALAEKLASEFAVETTTAETDVQELLAALLVEGLVKE
jgi:hypothetical protein